MPRTAVKGQVLADLVAEFAKPSLEEEEVARSMNEKSVGTVYLQRPTYCEVYVDGMANQRGFDVGLVLVSPERITIEKSIRLGCSAMNNEAECEALLEGMSMVQKLGGKSVNAFSNSKIVVGQVNGELEARDERMQEYLDQAKLLRLYFRFF